MAIFVYCRFASYWIHDFLSFFQLSLQHSYWRFFRISSRDSSRKWPAFMSRPEHRRIGQLILCSISTFFENLTANSWRRWRQIPQHLMRSDCNQGPIYAASQNFVLENVLPFGLGFECLWTLVEVLNGTMGRLGARLRRDDKERVPWNESCQYWQQAWWLSRSWVFACFIWKGVIDFVGTAF